jgi:hypothetical protein
MMRGDEGRRVKEGAIKGREKKGRKRKRERDQ